MKFSNYELTEIGRIELGVESVGWDTYYKVVNNVDALDHKDLKEKALNWFWRDTNKPAGGYFCNSVSVYMNTLYDKNNENDIPYNLILVVHHRYDV